MSSMHCAVTFDLKNSRQLANRAQVQKTLIQSIREFNETHADIIQAPFIIILGDEWQGLLKQRDHYQSAREFFARRIELPFYTGVGVGECTILDEELTANQLDGPAFYKARQAIKLAKQYNYDEVIIV